MRFGLFHCPVIFILVFVLGSCCKSQRFVATPNSLRINIVKEPATLDPRKARDLSSLALCRMFYEGLTRIGKSSEPEFALAKTVQVSEDGLTYTFELREALWSNAEPIKSSDFAKTWKSIFHPSFPSPLCYQLYMIDGAKKAKEGMIELDQIGIKTPNENTLIIRLEYPVFNFLEIVSFPVSFPVHSSMLEEEGEDSPITNGPFILKDWKHHDLIIAAKNEQYWDFDTVQLDQLHLFMVSADTEFKMYETKQLDWAGSPFSCIPQDLLPRWKKSPQFYQQEYGGTYFIRINTEKNQYLSNRSFRKMLSRSINRKSLAMDLLQGGEEAATYLIPRKMFKNDYRKKGLNSFEERADPMPFSSQPFILSYIYSPTYHLIAQAVQKQWQEQGIFVLLQAKERKVFIEDLETGKYDLALGSWIADCQDPLNFLEVFKYKNGFSNHTFWEDPRYVKSLDAAMKCNDLIKREEILSFAEEVLKEEVPIIPLAHMSLNYIKDPKVEGVYISPLGNIDFKWTRIKKE